MDIVEVSEMFAGGVVGDVLELGFEVGGIPDAVFMIAGVPDFAGRLIADGEGIAAFDELDGACGALVDCWCDEDVDVVGHDGEAMELELSGVAVAEESGDEKICVCGALEVAVALEGEDGDGVGALRLSDRGHGREHTPGAKALFFGGLGGPRLKPWLT